MNRTQNQIVYSLGIFLVLLVGGTIVFNRIEGWSYVDSLYFSVATISTLGYGDLVPTTDLSKIIVIFYSLAGIAIFLYFVSVMTKYYLEESHTGIIGGISKVEKVFMSSAFKKRQITGESKPVPKKQAKKLRK